MSCNDWGGSVWRTIVFGDVMLLLLHFLLCEILAHFDFDGSPCTIGYAIRSNMCELFSWSLLLLRPDVYSILVALIILIAFSSMCCTGNRYISVRRRFCAAIVLPKLCDFLLRFLQS